MKRRFLQTKKYILILCLMVPVWIGNSCKNDDPVVPDEKPEWLQQKITELVPDQALCQITYVTVFLYKGEIYYHVYCGIWSCMYCQFFNDQGNRPDWNEQAWNDFHSGAKEVKTMKACEQ